MAVEIYTKAELRRRTINRIDGKPAHGGAQHFQIGSCTLELDDEQIEQHRLQSALNRFVLAYIEQFNRNKPHSRMIDARVIGIEIQRLYES